MVDEALTAYLESKLEEGGDNSDVGDSSMRA